MWRHDANRLAIVLVLGLSALATGCVTSDSPTSPGNTSDAPALPDVSTMKFDFDFLGSNVPTVNAASVRAGKPTAGMQVEEDRTNFINAYVRALFLQLLVYDALEEPIGAFALAVNSVPQAQADGSYLWTYIFVDGAAEYSIFLYGMPQTDRVVWRLEVSTNDPAMPFDHFVWFDGESMLDDSGGFWQFYEPVEAMPAKAAGSPDGQATVRIDWTNAAPGDHTLRITVNGVGHPDEGDWLEFHETPSQVTIDYHDQSELVDSNITWNADGSGSITVPDYNNGLQACWDTNQVNTVCP